MYEAKTKPTKVSPASYIAAIADAERRKDCKQLVAIMKRITGEPAKMWGPSIVGFGQYHYQYASGHEGDSSIAAFSSRRPDLTVYLYPDYDTPAAKKLLAKLGPHKIGKSCLYVRRLADVDMAVLEQMIERSVRITQKKYPPREK